jgi:hypothetical protein
MCRIVAPILSRAAENVVNNSVMLGNYLQTSLSIAPEKTWLIWNVPLRSSRGFTRFVCSPRHSPNAGLSVHTMRVSGSNNSTLSLKVPIGVHFAYGCEFAVELS